MKRFIWIFAQALLLVSCRTHSTTSDPKFNGAEHKMLGDDGYARACASFAKVCPAVLLRANAKKSFTYGELVAFSGDFYGSWEEIYNATSDAFDLPLGILKQWDKVSQLKEILTEEEAAILSMQTDVREEYPDFNFLFSLSYGLKFLELAASNTSHFGWHNQKTYITAHTQALELAQQGFSATVPWVKEKFLMKALFANSFADHFLSDGFAAGHIRVPRAQALAWGARQKEPYSDRVGGVLAKILHDNDPCIYQSGLSNSCRGEKDSNMPHGVLKVQNARGDKWATRSDADLYRGNTKDAVHVKLPTEAVSVSVQEVIVAYTTGKLPPSTFAAIALVPFVSSEEIELAKGFDHAFTDQEIKNILESVGPLGNSIGRFITGLADTQKIRAYFKALPEMMKNFREDIARDLKADPNLAKRLPPAYIEAYLKVR